MAFPPEICGTMKRGHAMRPSLTTLSSTFGSARRPMAYAPPETGGIQRVPPTTLRLAYIMSAGGATAASGPKLTLRWQRTFNLGQPCCLEAANRLLDYLRLIGLRPTPSRR